MSTSSLGFMVSSCSGSGVSGNLSLHDKSILVKLSDGASRVSEGNLVGLVRVNPYSLFTAFQDGCS